MGSCRELDGLNKLHVLTTMIEHIFSDLLEENAVLQEFLKKLQTVDTPRNQEIRREMMVFQEDHSLESDILEDTSRDTESTFLGNLLSPAPIDLEVCSKAICHNKIATGANMPHTRAQQLNVLVHPFEEHSNSFPFSPVERSRGKSKMLTHSLKRPRVVSDQVLREKANTVASENFHEPHTQAHLIISSRSSQMLEARVQENPLHVEPMNVQELDLSTMEIFLHRAQVIDFDLLDFRQEWMMPRHIHSSSRAEGSSKLDDNHQLNAHLLEEGFDCNTSIQGFNVLEELLLSQKLDPDVIEEEVLEKEFVLESPSGTNHQRTDPKELDDIRQELNLGTLLFQEVDPRAALNMQENKPQDFEPSVVLEIHDLVDTPVLDDLSNEKINFIPPPRRDSSEVFQADIQAHHMDSSMTHECLHPLHRRTLQELPGNLFDEFFQHIRLIPCPNPQLQNKILQESRLPVKSSMLGESLLEDQSEPSKPKHSVETLKSVGREVPRPVDEIPGERIHDQIPSSNFLQQPQMPFDSVRRDLPVAKSKRENYRPPNILRVLLPQPIKPKETPQKNEQEFSSALPQVEEQQLLFRDLIHPTSNQPAKHIERSEPVDTLGDPHRPTHEGSKSLQFITIDSSMDSEIMSKIPLTEDERSALNVETKASGVLDQRVQNANETAEFIACFKEPCKDGIKGIIEEIQPDASEPSSIAEKMEQALPSPKNSGDSGVITESIGSSETCDKPRQPPPHELHPDSQKTLEEALPSRIQPFRHEHNNSAQLDTASGVDPTPNPAIREHIDDVMHQQSGSKPAAPQVPRPPQMNSLRSNHLKMLLEIHRIMNRNQACGCGLADLVLLSGEKIDILEDLKRVSQSPEFCRRRDLSGTKMCNSKAPKMCQFREPSSTLKISVFGLLVLAGGLYIVETLEKILCEERNAFSAADAWDLMGNPLLWMLVNVLEG